MAWPLPRVETDDADRTIAILGVGNIGAVHLRSAQALPDVSVVAAADAAEENRVWARQCGVSDVFADFRDCLTEVTPDVAVIALPPFLHREAVNVAAACGVNAFVEKPLGRTVEEVSDMAETAAAADITLGVDHTLRYQPDMVAVKEAFDDGTAGHVPFASFVRLNDASLGHPPIERAPAWQLDPEAAGGGALLELGVHCLDVLGWLFGPLELRDVALERTLELPVEDVATLRLEAPETGTTVMLHCGTYQWESLPAVNSRLCLEGVAGTIDSADHVPGFYRHAIASAAKNGLRRLVGRKPAIYAPTYYLTAHRRALEGFLAACEADEPAPVGPKEARRALSLIEEAYNTGGRPESIAPPAEVAP